MICTLAEANKEGDAKAIWDTDKPEEVAAAKAVYDNLRAKGYIAFSVDKDGKQKARMREFDPKAGGPAAA
jgi:hypothetical protein